MMRAAPRTAHRGSRSGPRRRRRAVLRPAIILREFAEQHPPLAFLIVVVAALEPLEIAHRAIEAVAQLLDLRVERLAFRRLAGEEREKSALAAAPFGVRYEAVEIGLLLAGGIFVALDLLGAGRVAGAAIERGHLAFRRTQTGLEGGCC